MKKKSPPRSPRKAKVNPKLRALMRSTSPWEKAPPHKPGEDWILAGKSYLPTDYKERKDIPIMTGVLDYFPLAICAVARVSLEGNNQHNPNEPLHWARGKSMDEINTAIRHAMERGGLDTDGQPHLAKAAWRILAALQKEEEERRGLPPSRACWVDPPVNVGSAQSRGPLYISQAGRRLVEKFEGAPRRKRK